MLQKDDIEWVKKCMDVLMLAVDLRQTVKR